MRKAISMLVLGVLPAIAMASSDHAGGHGMNSGHAVKQQHASSDMSPYTQAGGLERP